MKRDFNVVSIALFLIMGGLIFRLLGSAFPEVMPNISPMMAISFVGAMYLPRAWGWLVGPTTYLVTDLAFAKVNYLTGGAGSMFSSWTLVSLLVFAAAGALGIGLARHKTFARVIGGSLVCSLVFYLVSNTFSWWYDLSIHLTPGYPAGLAGWWQANTVGLPGYVPTWTFLRNGALGDLFFAVLLVLVLDRSLIFRPGIATAKNPARMA